MVEAAAEHTHGRVLSLLEGGYDLDALSASVAEHTSAMA
jgi:Deacetylases, including yeast histone deacetylase and acetoin utilization protein